MKLPNNIVANIIEYTHDYSTEPYSHDVVSVTYQPWISERTETFRFARSPKQQISVKCAQVLEQLQDAVIDKYGDNKIKKFKLGKFYGCRIQTQYENP